MIPIGAILVGIGLLAGGAVVLRSFGPGYRVARLLAATPAVTIDEAVALARSGRRRYVRITGRVDSDEDFPDEHQRPLVLRRVRVDVKRDGHWVPVSDDRRSVPFLVREGLAEIAVAHDAIGDGLVVLDRVSVGVAADAGGVVPDDVAPDTPVRLQVHQLSSVEHATVLGVPTLQVRHGAHPAAHGAAADVDADAPIIGPGLGRPLIVSVLEQDEAMQLLSGGRRGRARLAAILLAAGFGLIGFGLAWGAATRFGDTPVTLGSEIGSGSTTSAYAAAASPYGSDPTAEPSAPAGEDTRSSGEGAGLAGSPLLAIGAVLVLGLAAAGVTLAYVRLTGGRRDTA